MAIRNRDDNLLAAWIQHSSLMYDLIGDIHGYADELIQLLDMLGYQRVAGVYRHPDCQVIFLGDFIDRGPKIRETLEIVRPMVEQHSALAVMGNHEWNALAFDAADPDRPGEFLRRHSENNVRQHSQTLKQLTSDELSSHLNWFRTLPMWLDLPGVRVVHACWDDKSISAIVAARQGTSEISTSFLRQASSKGNPLYKAVEIVLKGKETSLPAAIVYRDKDGHERRAMRVRWYLPPAGHTYRTYGLTDEIACDLDLADTAVVEAVPYPPTAKRVFVGHYWLAAARPSILSTNVACLDYSVAKGGFLCAYRWRGEQKLNDDHFVWTDKYPARE